MTDKDNADKDPQYPNPDYSVVLHVKEVFNAFTQFVNAVLGSCDANQSTSERAYWNRGKYGWGWLYKTINFIAWRETDHCYKAKVKEDSRAINRLTNQGYTIVKQGQTVTQREFQGRKGNPDQGHKQQVYAAAAAYELDNDGLAELFLEEGERDQWKQWIKDADYDQMVKYYTDEALLRVLESGTNFAFTKEIAKKIQAAVQKEWGERYKAKAPSVNGMGEDGGQK